MRAGGRTVVQPSIARSSFKPDVVGLLPKLLWHMDEPIADTAFITTFLVSEFARQDVKVILSGVGGDELFGGYRRYLGRPLRPAFQRLPGWARRAAGPAPRLPADRHSGLLNAAPGQGLSRLGRNDRRRALSQLPAGARAAGRGALC
jgi:asparagine synthetase B (glutamine-hydrolysing)